MMRSYWFWKSIGDAAADRAAKDGVPTARCLAFRDDWRKALRLADRRGVESMQVLDELMTVLEKYRGWDVR